MRGWTLAVLLALCARAAEPPPAPAAPASTEGRLTPEERARLAAERARLSAAARSEPKNAERWRELGFVCQALGDAKGAREAFLRVVTLLPDDAPGWYMLALVYEKLGERAKAAEAWERCASRAQDPALAQIARKHLRFLR